MKFLCVGDLHIRVQEFQFILSLTEKIKEEVQCEKCDAVIFLGDILDSFGILEMDCAVKLIKETSQVAEVYVIVGNHDYISNHEFLTDKHWMNPLKGQERIHIVDGVSAAGNVIFCPFVEEGRFMEALETIGSSWREASVIFCHQGFKGVPMRHGLYSSPDEWSKDLPQIISGHIHGHQRLDEMGVYYPGSIESSKKSYFLIVEVSAEKKLYIAPKVVGQFKTESWTGSISELIQLERLVNNMEITIRDTNEAIRLFKETSTFKEMRVVNSFRFIPLTVPFLDLYRTNILDSGDVYTFCAAERVLTGQEMNEKDHLLIRLERAI